MSRAIRDAHNLGWKLAMVENGGSAAIRTHPRRKFHVRCFGDTPEVRFDIGTLHVVARPTVAGDIADTEGHLAADYGANENTLVLIRPDGYIGLISDAGDTSAARDYLAAFGGLPLGSRDGGH